MKVLTSLGLTAAVVVVSTAAIAADLPNKKKAPATVVAPRTVSWNGVYAGVNGGLIDANSNGSGRSVIGDSSGGLFGLTAGYNVQMPNNFVLGVEGDYGMSNADGSGTIGSNKVETLTTVRARAGLAMDRLMPFVTAGYAGSNVKFSDGSDTDKKFLNGWAAGAGAEYAITDNFSAKAEALYVSLDKARVPDGSRAGYDTGVYRLGLNYHF